jgi:hypothetical protein
MEKINKFEVFVGMKDHVVFWVITLSDSEMKAVCSSKALILAYQMTYCHTKKASI